MKKRKVEDTELAFETSVLSSVLQRVPLKERNDLLWSLGQWRFVLIKAERSPRYADRRLAEVRLQTALSDLLGVRS